jgi:hypothetical protein
VYGLVLVLIIRFALSDLISFQIIFAFWQLSALLAKFRTPWPPLAQNTLAGFSVANINIEGFPFKCFFDTAPTYRDVWYLTVFVPPGACAIVITRWMLPFLTVPPSGKALMRMFKGAMARRDTFKGTGTVVRSQYTGSRRPPTDPVRPPTRGSDASTRSLLRPASRAGGSSLSGEGGAGLGMPDMGDSSGGGGAIKPFADFARKRPPTSILNRQKSPGGTSLGVGGGKASPFAAVGWVDDASGHGSRGGISRGSARSVSDLNIEDVGIEGVAGSTAKGVNGHGANFGSPSSALRGSLRDSVGGVFSAAGANFGSPGGSSKDPPRDIGGSITIRGEALLHPDLLYDHEFTPSAGERRSTSHFVPRNKARAPRRRFLDMSTHEEETASPSSQSSRRSPGGFNNAKGDTVIVLPGAFSSPEDKNAGRASLSRVHVSGSRFGTSAKGSTNGDADAGGSTTGGGPGRLAGFSSQAASAAVGAAGGIDVGDNDDDAMPVKSQADLIEHRTSHIRYPLFDVAAAQTPDLLIIEEAATDSAAISRPASRHSRSMAAAAAYSRPSSRVGTGRSVTFPDEPDEYSSSSIRTGLESRGSLTR